MKSGVGKSGNKTKKSSHSRSILFYVIVVGAVLAVILSVRSLSNIIHNYHADIPLADKSFHSEQSSQSNVQVSPTLLDYERPTSQFSKAIVKRNEKPVRIAYIFAGSVRSFLCPKVHWSIRLHLMDALGGEAHSFIRLSTEDNKNTKTGDGIVFSPDHDLRELNATLRVLNPKAVEYFQLSTQEIEMERNYPSMTHKVFRKMDQRRYSMFYHRCMAYRLAKQFEQKQDWKFDWVVLVRLDAGWLEPVLPIQYWANDRVWLTETGFVPYNDQFMLIPRQFSDYLYDLDTKARLPVYCLGGPDVERWKCNQTELTKIGYDQEFINATLGLCCDDVFGRNRMGFSETIHMRHLEVGNIPVSIGRFPVYLTRKLPAEECYADCPRLYYNFKDFAYDVLQRHLKDWKPMDSTDTRALPISETDASRCSYLNSAMSPWQPISALEYENAIARSQQQREILSSLHLGSLRGGKGEDVSAKNETNLNLMLEPIDLSANLYKQWDRLHPSLRINPLQYATWRIHASWNVDGCITVNMTSKEMTWENCNLYLRYKGGRRHDPRQAFLMHVQPHIPAIVRDVRLRAPEDELLYFSSRPLPAITTITIPKRIPNDYDLLRPLWCWTVREHKLKIRDPELGSYSDVVEPVSIHLEECSTALYTTTKQTYSANLPQLARAKEQEELASRQRFFTVQGEAMGAHPSSTVGHIRPMNNPEFCVVQGPSEDDGLGRRVSHNALNLVKCKANNVGTSKKYFEFEYLHG